MKQVSVGVLLLVVLLSYDLPCLAKVYTVGDSDGWSLIVDYTTWTSDKTFNVGDILVFNYGSSHTVDEVSASDYGPCTVGNSIGSYTSAPTSITLNTTGTHYFICGVVGHCSGGMKMSVAVTKGGGGATPTPSGTTVNPSTPPPRGNTTTNISGTSSNISPVVALVFSLVSCVFELVLV